jgi:hypothetical protein
MEGDGVATTLNELATEYGIEIIWDQGPYEDEYPGGRRVARDAAEWEIELYAPILAEELGLYPIDLVERSGLRRIILCRDLWVEAEGVDQHVSATLDSGTIYLSASYTYKVNNRPKQRRVVHHVFFHLLEAAMGSNLADPEWEALNPDGFHYGDYGAGGQHDRTSASGLLTTDYPGFLNRYSTGHHLDDKGDMFAYMMVVHHYVEGRAERDEIIRAKMEEIKRRLAAFAPGVNGGFWARVAAIGRDVTPYTIM